MPDTAIRNRFLPLLTLTALGLLFFVWPIAHTTALRYCLLLFALLLSGYLTYAIRVRLSEILFRHLRVPTTAYFLLTAWIYVVAIAISPETAWSLSEVAGQWMTGLLALLLGVFAATLTGKGVFGKYTLLRAVFFLLLLHILYIDYAGIAGLWHGGALARPQIGVTGGAESNSYLVNIGLTGGPENDNYLTNMLMGILVAEALFRHIKKRRHLPVGNLVLLGLIGATLFSAYLEARRSGLVDLVFLVVFAALFYFFEGQRRQARKTVALAVLLAFAAASLVAYVSIKTDPRWYSLRETIPIAWDTGQQKAWLDSTRYPLPLLPNGVPVEDSNYKRIAFLKEGTKLVLEHPLGLGYGRNAFGHGLVQKYGSARVGHSHSGFLDLAIGIGVPGVILWLAFMGSLLYMAYKSYAASSSFFAALLVILVADFNLRMVVDSINRDHSLQQFLFLVGLYVLMGFNERGNAP